MSPACQMANQLIRRSLSVGSTTAQHMEMLAEPSREGWLSLAPEQTPEDPGGEGAPARDHTSGGQRCMGRASADYLDPCQLERAPREVRAGVGQLPRIARLDSAAELENLYALRGPP